MALYFSVCVWVSISLVIVAPEAFSVELRRVGGNLRRQENLGPMSPRP